MNWSVVFSLAFLFAGFTCGQEEKQSVEELLKHVSEELRVTPTNLGDDEKKRSFVIRHKAKEKQKAKGIGIILPGGPGSDQFLPFCANVLAKRTFPDDWVVVELVAPVWGEMKPTTTVWPSKLFPVKGAKFTTEEFIDAAIAEARKDSEKDAPVILLPWSSSGHAAISATMNSKDIAGVLLCCSRSLPFFFKPKAGAKGKSFFLYHSPDDKVTIFSDAEAAVKFLPEMGARAKLVTYEGGHGWPPTTDHAKNLRAGIEWILEGAE